jgi:hypothetical protein
MPLLNTTKSLTQRLKLGGYLGLATKVRTRPGSGVSLVKLDVALAMVVSSQAMRALNATMVFC